MDIYLYIENELHDDEHDTTLEITAVAAAAKMHIIYDSDLTDDEVDDEV